MKPWLAGWLVGWFLSAQVARSLVSIKAAALFLIPFSLGFSFFVLLQKGFFPSHLFFVCIQVNLAGLGLALINIIYTVPLACLGPGPFSLYRPTWSSLRQAMLPLSRVTYGLIAMQSTFTFSCWLKKTRQP